MNIDIYYSHSDPTNPDVCWYKKLPIAIHIWGSTNNDVCGHKQLHRIYVDIDMYYLHSDLTNSDACWYKQLPIVSMWT